MASSSMDVRQMPNWFTQAENFAKITIKCRFNDRRKKIHRWYI